MIGCIPAHSGTRRHHTSVIFSSWKKIYPRKLVFVRGDGMEEGIGYPIDLSFLFFLFCFRARTPKTAVIEKRYIVARAMKIDALWSGSKSWNRKSQEERATDTLTGWERKKRYKNTVGGVYDGVRPRVYDEIKRWGGWVINAFSAMLPSIEPGIVEFN